MVEFKSTNQRSKEESHNTPKNVRGVSQDANHPSEGTPPSQFDQKARIKALRQSTVLRKQTLIQPRQTKPGPVFRVHKKSAAATNSHRGKEEAEDHHLDFVMKKELDADHAARIIQRNFKWWVSLQYAKRMRLERKQRAAKKPSKDVVKKGAAKKEGETVE
jgi:hypothetical protein